VVNEPVGHRGGDGHVSKDLTPGRERLVGRDDHRRAFIAGADELGYLPMPAEAASYLFQVVTRRSEHGSIILISNRHIADWGQIFDDTTVAIAILDRLLRHASVVSINGDSYRVRPPRRHQRATVGDHRWGKSMIPLEELR
jgi:hypothetical protein